MHYGMRIGYWKRSLLELSKAKGVTRYTTLYSGTKKTRLDTVHIQQEFNKL